MPPLPSGQKAVVQTARGEKVRIHPHSANFRLVHYNLNSQRKEFLNRPLLVFDEVTRGEASMSIKNCTLVKPYPLLLLATEMVVAPLDPDEEMDLKMMIKDVQIYCQIKIKFKRLFREMWICHVRHLVFINLWRIYCSLR